MSKPTVVLITGSNRGIGLEFTKTYLARPNHIVVAAVRDPAKSQKIFAAIKPASNSRSVVVRIDSHDRNSAMSAIKEIQGKGVDHLDIVIANAGINLSKGGGEVRKFDLDPLGEHFQVNTAAPVALYQATRPLLAKSRAQNGPLFVPMSSVAASISGIGYMGAFSSYGASKAALNYLFVRAHTEILFHNGNMHLETDWSILGEKGVLPYQLEGESDEAKKDRLAIVILHPG